MFVTPRRTAAQVIASQNNAMGNMARVALGKGPDYYQQCTVTIVYPGVRAGEWYEWRCPIRGQHWVHCDVNMAPVGTTDDVMWLREQWKTATA